MEEINPLSAVEVRGVAQTAREGFHQDAFGIGLYGVQADVEFAGYFFVGLSLVVERQDLLLGG